MTTSSNLIPKLGLGTVLAFFVYGAAFVPNDATGGPVEMFGIAGAGLMYAAIVLTIVTAFVSARRAFRTGKWAWFVAVILIWPLTYLYALAINRTG